MPSARPQKRLVLGLAGAVAVLFGLATLVAGSRVLLGTDPGYVVYRPLLVYNTIMGVAYLAAGVAIWRGLRGGVYPAATIFVLNLSVLVGVTILRSRGGAIAEDSLRAMTLRTLVWLVIALAVARAARPHTGP